MVKYWRSNGIKIIMFLDDGWGTNKTYDLTLSDSVFVKKSLIEAGFVINDEKSIWVPAQILEWIGICWNSVDFSISIPSRRVNDCILTLDTILNRIPLVTARLLAQCAGKIISLSPVFGNLTRLMTRYLYLEIETRKSWDGTYKLSPTSPGVTEIKFWRSNLRSLNKRFLSGYSPTCTLVYSDASHVAAGSYIVNCKDSVFHNIWSDYEKGKSSTFREIRAVKLALRAYGQLLKGKSVKWFSDSQSCVHIVQSGSTKPELQEESLKIFELCLKWNIDMKIQWVPREQNSVADDISKLNNTDEWEVTDDFFRFVDSLWGPHNVDRFASSQNRKLKLYNSKFLDFDTEAIDAFTQDWSGCNNWLVPPIRLVSRTIFHLLHYGAVGTLIVPKWPSASFWPIIFKKNFMKQDFISEILEFKSGQDIFKNNNQLGNCIFDGRRFRGKVLAVRIN
ncbi:uncharacterized protein LOC123560830 [Mercenaria mercenaria]|uniref:uncharacterized protein LOC123560830 n=1 Tax=Mercenaria mercenaria TaxID=6596 RepID=UPI00234F7382|nr:uncharacterized protein LOC123560830 [Mercenaria mercenaria]